MENLCIMIDTECPKCGQLCRSIGPLEVIGWECPICGYYDPEFDWLSSEGAEVFETEINFELLEFESEMEVEIHNVRSQSN